MIKIIIKLLQTSKLLERASYYRAIHNGLVCISVVMSVLHCISAADSASGSSVTMKASLRKDINSKLSCLASSYVEERSAVLRDTLMQVKQFSESQALSSYLSMPQGEIVTYDIIQLAFQQKKRVFIPKILGKQSHDMLMFEIPSFAVLNSFDRNRWGIPEPSREAVSNSLDGTSQGVIDLILVPGVAFDPMCGRLGHGKGYYDCFIDRVNKANEDKGKPRPYLLGLALDEQIVEAVPLEAHDNLLDAIITPTRMFINSSH